MWKEVQDRIGPLLRTMSNTSENVDQYCNDVPCENDATICPNRVACQYIARGLKGIYGNTERKSDTGASKVNNRKFRATMDCVLLNALIQKLEEKKSPCKVKDGIERAFSANDQIKASACGQDPNCDLCTQEDYKKCKINEYGDLEQKVKTKVEKDSNIQTTLDSICPPPCPSTSGTATLGEWFTRFSHNVTGDDKKQYDKLESMLDLCNPEHDDNNIGLENYEEFCKMMLRNVMLVSTPGNQDQKQGKQMPCIKSVKGIPLCKLLRVWMWYMDWFCVPEAVIEHVLEAVKQVMAILYSGQNYVDCTYDAAPKIPERKGNDMESEVYRLFYTSELHNKIKALTNKEWCKKAPADSGPGRADLRPADHVVDGDKLQKLKDFIKPIEEELQEEEKAEKPAPDPGKPPRPPAQDITTGDTRSESEEQSPKKTPEKEEDSNSKSNKLKDEYDNINDLIHFLDSSESHNDDTEKSSDEPGSPEKEAVATEDSSEDEQGEDADEGVPKQDEPDEPALPPPAQEGPGGGAGATAVLESPKAAKLTDKMDNPIFPYLPLAPAMIGISIMSYLLWKYFGMLRKTRKRYRRVRKALGPTLEHQLVDHVDHPGPHAYALVKERKPRSTPIKRRKKRGLGCPRAGRRRGVRRRTIIDIHLEVLDECQKGGLHSTKEDFFEILVQEFMGYGFLEEENVPKEQVPCLDSGFRVDVPREDVPSSVSGFREGRLCS
ncbi:SICA antigen [Plasmodium coatneyi]|uniref:SICA antigen n=1 Tax=Plasmodium coatneyi TaxID=208452 RepID=A0A1B1DZQ2_9APIC|nr:SICA antigen [Plasmodium coatneyi]ANQ08261.1 SICA antigen [Plasmodium coatneyi]